MVAFKKDFYREHDAVSSRDKHEIKKWMTEKEVAIEERGDNKVRVTIRPMIIIIPMLPLGVYWFGTVPTA